MEVQETTDSREDLEERLTIVMEHIEDVQANIDRWIERMAYLQDKRLKLVARLNLLED